jgi:Protein kinase domain
VTSTSVPASAHELFHRWKQFLDGGTFTTATFVAGDQPELVDPLQQLINHFLADQAFEVEETHTAAPAPSEPEPPPEVPGLTVLERLGGGGMGVVYRVRDPLDREFALKVARREQLSEAGRERFLEEARAMVRLEGHPHVARVHTYDNTLDGRPYFLMAIYPSNLASRLADYQADPEKAVRLIAAVSDGVGHLHAQGFIHRDLKPPNILLTADGQPAVSDFGLVKSLSDCGSASPARPAGSTGSGETKPSGPRRSKTVAGAVMGTRRYMAPEQAAGLIHLASPQWDVWTLGVVLHELLTGQLPRSCLRPERMLDPDEPDNPPPSTVRPGLDRKLERIVRRCLARDPAARYPDGAAVARDLRAWLDPPPARWTRWLAVTAAVLLIVSAVVASLTPWWKRTPDSGPQPNAADTILADFQARVRNGGSVEIIPAAEMPIWYDLAVGKGLVQPHQADDDGALLIDSGRTILIDMPPTGLERFRFEVQVRQVSDDDRGRFGIYAGRHTLGTTTGEANCFLSLWFNDRIRPPGQPPQLQWARWVRFHCHPAGAGAMSSGHQFDEVEVGVRAPGEYHTLAAEVRPEGVTFFRDGQATQAIHFPLTAEAESPFAKSARLIPGTKTDFSPAGGYGLIAAMGSGAFRNATVRKLDE